MEFTPEIIEEIKFYVYSYSDPDTKLPFYIGKGQGNRCFDHLMDQTDSKKVKKIQELHKNQKEPVIELLRYGLNNNEATLLEAALIDFVGLENLTNKVRGLHSRSFGKTSVEDTLLRYTAEDVSIDNDDKVILISIGKSYSKDMPEDELYEYSRGVWRVNPERHDAEFALIVFHRIIRQVYKISKWYEAGTLEYKYRDSSSIDRPGRWEFEGEIADEEIRDKYINKSVRKYFARGAIFPIRYIHC